MPDFGIMRGFGSKLFSDKLVAGQLPTQLGLIGSQSAYDVDAQAFFDRVATAGGTLSNTEKNAVNQLVLDMKNAGIWTSMKAVYPMVGASSAACKQNLVSSSFTGTFSTGWTFASTGVQGNGTSAYFDTTCIPNVSLNQNSQHLCYYSRDNFNNSLISCGGGPYHQNLYTGGSFYGILSSSSFTPISIATTKGMSLISRISSGSGVTAYWNNTNIGNDGNPSSSQYNYSLYVNARNAANTGDFFSSNECAFASIGDGLTSTQASNFYTAVQAFQTTLSRQV